MAGQPRTQMDTSEVDKWLGVPLNPANLIALEAVAPKELTRVRLVPRELADLRVRLPTRPHQGPPGRRA